MRLGLIPQSASGLRGVGIDAWMQVQPPLDLVESASSAKGIPGWTLTGEDTRMCQSGGPSLIHFAYPLMGRCRRSISKPLVLAVQQPEMSSPRSRSRSGFPPVFCMTPLFFYPGSGRLSDVPHDDFGASTHELTTRPGCEACVTDACLMMVVK